MLRNYLLFLLFFVAGSVFSQDIFILGTITDTNNIPLSNVAVKIKTSKDSISTHSAKDGSYSATLSRKDRNAVISFSHIGYQGVEIKDLLPKTEALRLNMVLQDSISVLESVDIVTVKTLTNMFQTLDAQFAQLLPATSGGTIESLISTFSGVSTTNELSSQYSVRGGNIDENMVYVNGTEIYRPLLTRSAQQEGLSFINPDMIKSVGFSTGGFSAEYGDKMSSVLDIEYRKPSKFEGAVEGSFLGGSAYVGSSHKGLSQITGIRYKTNESLLKTTDTDAEYDPAFLDIQSYINYEISPKWQIDFLGNYSHNRYNFTPQTRETKFGTLEQMTRYKVYFSGWENDKFTNYHLSGGVKGQISDHLKMGLSTSYFSSYEKESYDVTGQYILSEQIDGENGSLLGTGSYHEHARNRLDADIFSLSYSGELNHYINRLRWGFTYQNEQIDDHIREWEMRDSTGYSLPYNGETVNVYSNLKSKNKLNTGRYSGYVQDRFLHMLPSGLLTVNGGVRFSYWSFNKELNISPRLMVSYRPNFANNIIVHAATGMYYQTPFYREMQLITNEGGNNTIELNKNIKSQKSTHYILGSDLLFKSYNRTFKFTSEIYYKHLSDIIPYTVNNVKVRYSGENMAKGYTTGIDLRLSGEFVAGAHSWISLSLMKTEQNIQGVKVPLPTDQRYNISAYFQDYMPGYDRLKMSLLGHFSHGLPVSPPYKGFESGYFRKPAYKRIDIGLSWQVLGEDFAIRDRNQFCRTFKNIWLGLDVFNVFDIKNTNTYYWITDVYNHQYGVPNYLTGRQFNLKLRAEF